MEFDNLKTENIDGVLWVTVNRPEKLNALNCLTLDEIDTAIGSAASDSDIHAVVITGAGEKAFVAGADISELNTLGAIEAKEFALRGQAIFSRIETRTNRSSLRSTGSRLVEAANWPWRVTCESHRRMRFLGSRR